MHDAISLYLVEGFYETAQIFIILVGIAEKVFFYYFCIKNSLCLVAVVFFASIRRSTKCRRSRMKYRGSDMVLLSVFVAFRESLQ